jgi:hypothetical protein
MHSCVGIFSSYLKICERYELKLFGLKMAASIGINNPCQYCLIFTVDHSEAFLQSAHDLSLDYERSDILPDFPQLDASAKGGCAFCGLLRVSCQSYCAQPFSADGKTPYEGIVQIYGAKITSVGSERGMTTLQVSFRPADSAYDLPYSATVYFSLHSYNGSTHLCLILRIFLTASLR